MAEKFSDEFLNAFVDDELATEEKSRAYLAMQQDDALSRQVCELRSLRDLVRLAYRDVPPPPARRGGRTMKLNAIAAGVALAVGVAIGWVLHTPPSTLPVATTAPAVTVAGAEQMKVLIHISDGRPAHLKGALDEIENLARFYRTTGQNARIEVVTNGDGINLLRADTSPYAARVAQLQRDYDNLVFEACQNTLDSLRNERAITARLLPGVTVIDSGVAQIMRRQTQGWAYIQV
jgi:uncharacterized protein